MIAGGYYIKARCIQDSEIAFAPPHVREIWDWLIKEANHEDTKQFKRGQCFRSIQDIRDGLKWFVGYRKMTYSKSKCEYALNWLRSRTMIETMKTTRGMIITVCNYDTYQTFKNYEKNTKPTTKDSRNEQPQDTINKEEIKEEGKILTWREDFTIYLKECKEAYAKLTNDEKFIKKLQMLNPRINILSTIHMGFEAFWGTEDGWINKKSRKEITKINWRSTISRSLNKNTVYYSREEIEKMNK